MARRFSLMMALLAYGLFAGTVRADTFKLAGGESLVGELLVASANDAGVQVKIGEGDYKRVSWANFSQEDLKNFSKNPKLEALVEPFIEISQEEKLKRTEVTIKQPSRLEHPASGSLIGALFSSALGILVVLVLYAANLYAGYEVSILRAQPAALVCGVSAILPIIGPIIFLSMRTKMPASAENWEPTPAAAAPASVNPMQATPSAGTGATAAQQPAGLRVAGAPVPSEPIDDETPTMETPVAQPQKAALPAPTTFKRGQFTFNRRFIETKFAGFLGVVRRDAEREMVLVMKTARGEFTGTRISNIGANELHFQVQRGTASEDVMIPFQDIQEITLKHQDS